MEVNIQRKEFLSIKSDIESSYKLLINSINNLENLKKEASESLITEDLVMKDVSHYLELADYGRGDYQKFGKILKESRLVRRDAKDTLDAINRFLNVSLRWENFKSQKNEFEMVLFKTSKFIPIWEIDRSFEFKILDLEKIETSSVKL